MSNKLIDIVNVTKSFDESVILDHLNLYIRNNRGEDMGGAEKPPAS